MKKKPMYKSDAFEQDLVRQLLEVFDPPFSVIFKAGEKSFGPFNIQGYNRADLIKTGNEIRSSVHLSDIDLSRVDVLKDADVRSLPVVNDALTIHHVDYPLNQEATNLGFVSKRLDSESVEGGYVRSFGGYVICSDEKGDLIIHGPATVQNFQRVSLGDGESVPVTFVSNVGTMQPISVNRNEEHPSYDSCVNIDDGINTYRVNVGQVFMAGGVALHSSLVALMIRTDALFTSIYKLGLSDKLTTYVEKFLNNVKARYQDGILTFSVVKRQIDDGWCYVYVDGVDDTLSLIRFFDTNLGVMNPLCAHAATLSVMNTPETGISKKVELPLDGKNVVVAGVIDFSTHNVRRSMDYNQSCMIHAATACLLLSANINKDLRPLSRYYNAYYNLISTPGAIQAFKSRGGNYVFATAADLSFEKSYNKGYYFDDDMNTASDTFYRIYRDQAEIDGKELACYRFITKNGNTHYVVGMRTDFGVCIIFDPFGGRDNHTYLGDAQAVGVYKAQYARRVSDVLYEIANNGNFTDTVAISTSRVYALA